VVVVGVGKGGGEKQQDEEKEEEVVVVVVEKTELPGEARFLLFSAATKEERTPSLEASTLS
jgi:hypothetical protein